MRLIVYDSLELMILSKLSWIWVEVFLLQIIREGLRFKVHVAAIPSGIYIHPASIYIHLIPGVSLL